MRVLSSVVLAAAVLVAGPLAGGQEPPAAPRLPAQGNDEAWQRLPRAVPTLPAWARVLAGPLPQTVGAMLELDYLHRADNPLGPILAGKLRWATADALGCDYGRRYAAADLRRAGLTDAELARLAGDPAAVPELDRLILAFARKMALATETVTDAEVATLLERLGPEKLVAVVHTLAHANFQDRIFLALAVTVEPDGPLPPLRPGAAKPSRTPTATPHIVALPTRVDAATGSADRPKWAQRDIGDLQAAVRQQKVRTPRIPLPDAGRLAGLPPEIRARASRIAWSTVSMGYQPRLTAAWFECMDLFQREAELDRVFSNCFFWVVTRSNECFY
jgi:hypothetical protein